MVICVSIWRKNVKFPPLALNLNVSMSWTDRHQRRNTTINSHIVYCRLKSRMVGSWEKYLSVQMSAEETSSEWLKRSKEWRGRSEANASQTCQKFIQISQLSEWENSIWPKKWRRKKSIDAYQKKRCEERRKKTPSKHIDWSVRNKIHMPVSLNQ